MTSESRLIGKLERGDLILSDKGFPRIVEDVLNASSHIVMPPFKTASNQFNAKENDDAYNIGHWKLQTPIVTNLMTCEKNWRIPKKNWRIPKKKTTTCERKLWIPKKNLMNWNKNTSRMKTKSPNSKI